MTDARARVPRRTPDATSNLSLTLEAHQAVEEEMQRMMQTGHGPTFIPDVHVHEKDKISSTTAGKNTKSADNSPVPPKSEVVRTPTKPITLEGSEHPAMFEKRHSKPTWSSKANPAKSFRKLTVLQANDEDGKHVYEVENTETKVRKSKIYMCGLF